MSLVFCLSGGGVIQVYICLAGRHNMAEQANSESALIRRFGPFQAPAVLLEVYGTVTVTTVPLT